MTLASLSVQDNGSFEPSEKEALEMRSTELEPKYQCYCLMLLFRQVITSWKEQLRERWAQLFIFKVTGHIFQNQRET